MDNSKIFYDFEQLRSFFANCSKSNQNKISKQVLLNRSADINNSNIDVNNLTTTINNNKNRRKKKLYVINNRVLFTNNNSKLADAKSSCSTKNQIIEPTNARSTSKFKKHPKQNYLKNCSNNSDSCYNNQTNRSARKSLNVQKFNEHDKNSKIQNDKSNIANYDDDNNNEEDKQRFCSTSTKQKNDKNSQIYVKSTSNKPCESPHRRSCSKKDYAIERINLTNKQRSIEENEVDKERRSLYSSTDIVVFQKQNRNCTETNSTSVQEAEKTNCYNLELVNDVHKIKAIEPICSSSKKISASVNTHNKTLLTTNQQQQQKMLQKGISCKKKSRKFTKNQDQQQELNKNFKWIRSYCNSNNNSNNGLYDNKKDFNNLSEENDYSFKTHNSFKEDLKNFANDDNLINSFQNNISLKSNQTSETSSFSSSVPDDIDSSESTEWKRFNSNRQELVLDKSSRHWLANTPNKKLQSNLDTHNSPIDFNGLAKTSKNTQCDRFHLLSPLKSYYHEKPQIYAQSALCEFEEEDDDEQQEEDSLTSLADEKFKYVQTTSKRQDSILNHTSSDFDHLIKHNDENILQKRSSMIHLDQIDMPEQNIRPNSVVDFNRATNRFIDVQQMNNQFGDSWRSKVKSYREILQSDGCVVKEYVIDDPEVLRQINSKKTIGLKKDVEQQRYKSEAGEKMSQKRHDLNEEEETTNKCLGRHSLKEDINNGSITKGKLEQSKFVNNNQLKTINNQSSKTSDQCNKSSIEPKKVHSFFPSVNSKETERLSRTNKCSNSMTSYNYNNPQSNYNNQYNQYQRNNPKELSPVISSNNFATNKIIPKDSSPLLNGDYNSKNDFVKNYKLDNNCIDLQLNNTKSAFEKERRNSSQNIQSPNVHYEILDENGQPLQVHGDIQTLMKMAGSVKEVVQPDGTIVKEYIVDDPNILNHLRSDAKLNSQISNPNSHQQQQQPAAAAEGYMAFNNDSTNQQTLTRTLSSGNIYNVDKSPDSHYDQRFQNHLNHQMCELNINQPPPPPPPRVPISPSADAHERSKNVFVKENVFHHHHHQTNSNFINENESRNIPVQINYQNDEKQLMNDSWIMHSNQWTNGSKLNKKQYWANQDTRHSSAVASPATVRSNDTANVTELTPGQLYELSTSSGSTFHLKVVSCPFDGPTDVDFEEASYALLQHIPSFTRKSNRLIGQRDSQQHYANVQSFTPSPPQASSPAINNNNYNHNLNQQFLLERPLMPNQSNSNRTLSNRQTTEDKMANSQNIDFKDIKRLASHENLYNHDNDETNHYHQTERMANGQPFKYYSPICHRFRQPDEQRQQQKQTNYQTAFTNNNDEPDNNEAADAADPDDNFKDADGNETKQEVFDNERLYRTRQDFNNYQPSQPPYNSSNSSSAAWPNLYKDNIFNDKISRIVKSPNPSQMSSDSKSSANSSPSSMLVTPVDKCYSKENYRELEFNLEHKNIRQRHNSVAVTDCLRQNHSNYRGDRLVEHDALITRRNSDNKFFENSKLNDDSFRRNSNGGYEVPSRKTIEHHNTDNDFYNRKLKPAKSMNELNENPNIDNYQRKRANSGLGQIFDISPNNNNDIMKNNKINNNSNEAPLMAPPLLDLSSIDPNLGTYEIDSNGKIIGDIPPVLTEEQLNFIKKQLIINGISVDLSNIIPANSTDDVQKYKKSNSQNRQINGNGKISHHRPQSAASSRKINAFELTKHSPDRNDYHSSSSNSKRQSMTQWQQSRMSGTKQKLSQQQTTSDCRRKGSPSHDLTANHTFQKRNAVDSANNLKKQIIDEQSGKTKNYVNKDYVSSNGSRNRNLQTNRKINNFNKKW